MATRISEMAGEISFKFGMWTPLTGGQLCSEFGSDQIRDHRGVKMTFSFLQGVATTNRPVEPSATGIKVFDRQNYTLIA